ncbi:MAG TPA: hypothetical protein PLA12_12160 [Candidatus Hydrogenedens sp.]|nr:hypothetical protein [Candidatus Hydrogenedens sp.]
MGIGLLFIIPEDHLTKVIKAFEQAGVSAHIVGKAIKGERKVYYKGNLKYAQPN